MASQVPPKKGVAFNLGVNLYTNTGGLITAPSSVTANTAKDFSTAYEAASSVSVASTNFGLIKVVLDSTQMNGDVIAVEVEDDTANSVPFTAIIYTSANLLDEISTAIYGESTKLSTAIYGESTKLSTLLAALSTAVYGESTKLSTLITGVSSLVSAESTKLSTAIYGESTKLSTQIAALSSATVDSTAIANAVWASDAMMGRLGIVAYGTAQAADSTSLTLASSHAFGTDELNGAVLYITGDTGVGQSRVIVDYASDKASVDAWATTPNSSATYVVFAAPPASAESLPSVNVTQIAGSAVATGTAQLGVNVVSMADNSFTSNAISDGAVSKISSGLATDTAMSTSFAALSTKVDALSALTSSGFSSLVSTLGGVGAAVLSESTKLSTKVDALSTTVQAESTRLSTAIYGESTKLSTGIASLSANLSTVASAVSSNASAAQASTAVWDAEMVSTYSAKSLLRGMASVLLGKVSGSSGSTTVFRDVADSKDVVTAITDDEGNRTTVTLDLSS